jgi:hypothetical protein
MTATDQKIVWLSTVETDGRIEFRVGRSGDILIAEWPGLATFRAHRSSGWSEIESAPGIGPRWLAKLERGLAAAMLRQIRGELTLHASALASNERAALLLGPSGAGKSTLAAVLAQRPEMSLLADDTSPISFEADHARVGIGDPELWLFEDARVAIGCSESRPGKLPVAFSSCASEHVKIQAIIALSYGDVSAPRIEPLRGHAALKRLLEGTVRFVIDEPDVQLREISQLEQLARSTRIYELIRPRDLNRISECADVVAALLREATT